MFTIKNDLYDKILRPIDIKYCYDSYSNKYIEVNTIPQKWQLMIPMATQNVLGMHKDGTLSYIVNGKKSNHHDSTDSNRAKLKEAMKGYTSKQYQIMHNHIHKMICINAAIECYKNNISNQYEHIYINKLNEYMKVEVKLIDKMYHAYVSRLRYKLEELYGEITTDNRISENFKIYMYKCIKKNPEKAFEILVFLSLFEQFDKDKDFYTEFESHFATNNTKVFENNNKSINNLTQNNYATKAIINNSENPVSNILLNKMLLNNLPESLKCNLSVELVYNNNKWYALICLE